jgi:branched-subunit amino acid ABC-type transport system permease component
MQNITKNANISQNISSYIFLLFSTLLIINFFLDIVVHQFVFNFRIVLEIFFGSILFFIFLNKIFSNSSLTKMLLVSIGYFWGVILIVMGIFGVISFSINDEILSVHGDILTNFALIFGIGVFYFTLKHHLGEQYPNVVTLSLKLVISISIILNIFLLLLFGLNYLSNISNINLGGVVTGIFLFDIFFVFIVLLIVLSVKILFVKDNFQSKYFNNVLKREKKPNWIILSLLALMFNEILIITLFLVDSDLGSILVTDTIRNSLFTGTVYLLFGIGLTLVYKILNFANFAHGELVIFGPYIALLALNDVDLGFFPTLSLFIVFAFIFSALAALISDFFVFRPLRNKNAEPVTLMIASIGLSLVLRFTLSGYFGQAAAAITIGGAPYLNVVKAIVIFTGVLFVVLLELLLQKSKLGKAMRAMADNPTLAQASGIPLGIIIILVWIIGAGFAGAGGILRLIANVSFSPAFGFSLLLPTFAVVILGGIGSYRGAIVGGYLIGFAENIGTFSLIFVRSIANNFPGKLTLEVPIILGDFSIKSFYINFSFSQEYQFAIGFLILIAVLLIKPTGIFGEEVSKER